MRNDDLPGVLAIERVSFSTPWSERMFREELSSSLCRSLIGIIDADVAGYVHYAIVLDEIYLRNIAVHQDYRRCGIATMLLVEMARTSYEKGGRWCTLEVRRSNTDAINLYEKYGFERKGIRPLYYRDTREDALIMWVELSIFLSKTELIQRVRENEA